MTFESQIFNFVFFLLASINFGSCRICTFKAHKYLLCLSTVLYLAEALACQCLFSLLHVPAYVQRLPQPVLPFRVVSGGHGGRGPVPRAAVHLPPLPAAGRDVPHRPPALRPTGGLSGAGGRAVSGRRGRVWDGWSVVFGIGAALFSMLEM